jgi:ABC-type polysaccharide/polyol phosphate transport system ATPase subunit
MSDWIIKVENLGKSYRLHHQVERRRYVALRDVISDRVRDFFQRAKPSTGRAVGSSERTAVDVGPTKVEEFWALRNVSFDIKQGEVVGVIGRNGAGKSTLLKVLSQITEPTEGSVRIKGRVASLLEVGTGFHPELTGRENIFLNGAILGMTRVEVRRKFDEIVAFAEVDKFLDTPVKRYSSGMHVRLAFAVAAHLDPEILIVDEVLAVGDAEFQKKCLGKMSEVAHGGRTVLFVSHNLASLTALCSRGIVLNKGHKQADKSLSEAIEEYLNSGQKDNGRYDGVPNGKPFQIASAHIDSLSQSGIHVSGEPLRIRVRIRADRPIKQGCLSVQVTNHLNTPILHFCAHDHGVFFGSRAGVSILECVLPECWLNVGPHRLNLYLSDPPGGELYEVIVGVCPFEVDVRHATAWFGWRPDACCYLQKEQWVSRSNDDLLFPSGAALLSDR